MLYALTQAWDTNLVSTNGTYLSLAWNASGGGAFAILPLDRPGKLPDIYPLCRGHTAAVLDTDFSPFHNDIVVSGADDGTMGVWKVQPDLFDILDLDEKAKERAGGVKDLSPLVRLNTGGRRVGQVLFHPTASGVVAASTSDHQIKLFDITTAASGGAGAGDQQATVSLTGAKDSIQSLDYDYAGNRLVATSRDKKLRIFDPRKGGEAVSVGDGHQGVKGARVTWCGNSERIVTTGFSKMSDRQLFLWDARALNRPIKSVNVDSSNGVVMPFWSDNNVVFLAGKGDGNIRYYELEADELHYLQEYKSTDPQRGMTFVPRRALKAEENEIARAYKVTGNMIQPISFYVPRRAESFQSDIFPPARSSVPALSGKEFFDGKQAQPNLVSLEDGKTSSAPTPARAPTSTATSSQPPTPAAAAAAPPEPKPAPKEEAVAAPTPAAAPRRLPSPERKIPPATAAPTSSFGTHKEPSRPSSPVKSTYKPTAAAAEAPALSSAARANANGGDGYSSGATKSGVAADDAEKAELRRKVDELTDKLGEREGLIRGLELEIEKLKVNQARVREAMGL